MLKTCSSKVCYEAQENVQVIAFELISMLRDRQQQEEEVSEIPRIYTSKTLTMSRKKQDLVVVST